MIVPNDIAELGELVKRLRSADTKLRVFGSEEHGYQFGRVLSERELREFETASSISLPEDYRRFLATVGNGGAGPFYGLEPLENCRGDLAKPFPFTQATDRLSEQEQEEILGWELCGALELCHQGCAIYAYLVVNGVAFGTIWDGRESFRPAGTSFATWYRRWAERALRILENEKLVSRIKVGMSKADIQITVPGDWFQRDTGPASTIRLYEALDIPVQLELNERGAVVKVRPWLHI